MTVPGRVAVSGSQQEYRERTVESCGASRIRPAIRRKPDAKQSTKYAKKRPECGNPMKIESHPVFGDFWVCEDCGLGVGKAE